MLENAHITWKIYAAQVSSGVLFKFISEHAEGHVFPVDQYYKDAAAGALPQVTFVEPAYFGGNDEQSDEHPPSNPQRGQQFSARVIDALMDGPNWATSALFLTYDEHGGYYDHVVPPKAPKPDDIAPMSDAPFAFDEYGVRVPVVVVSPWSRSHFVSHDVHDHTSILRTIELRFGLDALTKRDTQTKPMNEFFDFSKKTFETPPDLPEATLDSRGVEQCAQLDNEGE